MSRPVIRDHFWKIYEAAAPNLSDKDLEDIGCCFGEEVGNVIGSLLSMVNDLGCLAISDEMAGSVGTGTFSHAPDVSSILFAIANSLEYAYTLNSVNGGARSDLHTRRERAQFGKHAREGSR